MKSGFALAAIAALASARPNPYISGEVSTYETYQYGKFSTRMRGPLKKGTVQSLFTYWKGPNWSWAEWNEIDVELVPSVTDSPFSTNVIYGDGTVGQLQQQEYDYSSTESDWHTYTFEWTPEHITWYFDGKVVRSLDSSNEGVWRMNKAQNLMMNFWTPTWSPWGDNLNDVDMPYLAEYDWVEVYSYDAASKGYNFLWRDEFDTLDLNRWEVSDNWAFDGNSTTFMASQVTVENSVLTLKLAKNSRHSEASEEEEMPEVHSETFFQ